MKKIVTISIIFVLSLSVFAQKPQTVEDIDVWVQNEIEAVRESFHKDSIDYMIGRTNKLNQKITKIKNEAERLKKKINSYSTRESIAIQDSVMAEISNVVTEPDTIALTDNADSIRIDRNHEESCEELLKKLTGEDEIQITRQFILDFIAMSDDIGQYIQIKEDLAEIDQLLVQRNLKLPDFESFIRDLQIVSFADSVLSSPYDEAKRVESQSKMKTVKFMTDKQSKCPLIDSLRHGLDIYFLSTSNMMDFISEITDCHQKYLDSKTDEEKDSVSNELTSNIEFEARVENFRSVKYMSDIYDKIISEILCYDEKNKFVFQKFNMDGLKEIKASLETMRQQN